MKKAALSLATLLLTVFAFAQDTLLVQGIVTNLTGAVVDVTIVTDDGQTGVVTTNADGTFEYYFLVQNTQGTITGSITNCDGETVVAEGLYTPFFPGVFLTLEYCSTGGGDVYGCTDFLALNYNPFATIDDGSCVYDNGGGDTTNTDCVDGIPAQFYLCTFGNGANVEIEILDDNGGVLFAQSGFNDLEIMYIDLCIDETVCYTVNMSNTEETGWYGGYWWLNVNGVQVATDSLDDDLSSETGSMGAGGACPTEGCTDTEALNYDSNATIDDGSCLYLEDCDCDDTYDPVCAYPLTGGGVFGEAETFDNACWALCQGAWIIYDGECGNPTVFGCMDPAAINYNPQATEDDGSCYYIEDCACDSLWAPVCGIVFDNAGGNNLDTLTFANACLAECVGAWIINDGSCEDPVVYGCMDTSALNYNPNATVDDGSCEYAVPCDDTSVIVQVSTGMWGNEMSWTITSDSTIVGSGSGYQDNGLYTHSLCLTDGCYTVEMLDSFGDGWNGGSMTIMTENGDILGTFSLDSGSIGLGVFGINADCGEPDVYGCTDILALNYNPAATIDDGSCIYDNGGGDSTWCDAFFIAFPDSSGSNTIWALNLTQGENLDFFWDFGDGNTSTEEYPQHTYDGDGPYNLCLTVTDTTPVGGITCTSTYCQEIGADMFPGFTGGGGNGFAPSQGFELNVISEMVNSVAEVELFTSFTVYPNPTSNNVTIQFDAKQASLGHVQLFDLQGRQVVIDSQSFNSGTNMISMDMSNIESGVYILSLTAGKTSKQQRVVRL